MFVQDVKEPYPDDGLTVELTYQQYVEKKKELELSPNARRRALAEAKALDKFTDPAVKPKLDDKGTDAYLDGIMNRNKAGGSSARDTDAAERTPVPGGNLPSDPGTLHTRLRPRNFDDVIGQDVAVAALQRLLAKPGAPHLYTFTGPAGVGKTTLARILAQVLDATATEMDAATHSGVDETREITEWAQYSSLDGKRKFLILDECHALSKAAWQALLKITEEPPAHVYFALCTTDPSKLPDTIKTRGPVLALKPVPLAVLTDYAERVIAQEQLSIPDGSLRYITGHAEGSVRQLLVSLATCNGTENIAAVQAVLEQAVEDNAFLALAQLLCSNRRDFSRARKMLINLREAYAAEATRIQLIEYVTAVFYKSDGVRVDLIGLLDALSRPIPQQGGWAALTCALYYAITPP